MSDRDWQSQECWCEGGSETRRPGNGGSEKEMRMEREVGADGTEQFSEEGTYWGNCMEKAERKTEKEMNV